MLHLVPTPIGNLEDMTYRAVRVLNEVSLILCEDTRTSSLLLSHYEIHTPLKSYHIFNEHQSLQSIIDILLQSEEVALITDAGTPTISDPGFLLVRECIKNNIEIECLPGSTAFVPALVSSGFSTDRFLFEGFLPHKKGRKQRLEQLKTAGCTIVLYESPYRVGKLLNELMEVFDQEKLVCICRELTKLHEEKIRGSLRELYEEYKDKQFRGEIVVVISK